MLTDENRARIRVCSPGSKEWRKYEERDRDRDKSFENCTLNESLGHFSNKSRINKLFECKTSL